MPYSVDTSNRRYRSLFCSFYWPRHPGYSGGEIRDFHLIRRLLGLSRLEFFSFHGSPPGRTDRLDLLGPFADGVYTPENLQQHWPDLVSVEPFHRNAFSALGQLLQREGWPVLGPRYHWEAGSRLANARAFCRGVIQKRLDEEAPDFLFVSPQLNPLALTLNLTKTPTRLILATYDVEAVRMRRLAKSNRGPARLGPALEARRAACFEKENLALYDGIIAVSDLDKRTFVAEYAVPSERVLVLENGVDPEHFAFRERVPTDRPTVAFVASLGYRPNAEAAWRLLRRIMPLVRARFPEAALWLVGQSPEPALLSRHDGDRTVVTGIVDDVRPYLWKASVGCVPLTSGSGTKYKLLEALSAGLPVVCSPLALEGLSLRDGEHVILGESDAELAAGIVGLLAAPERAAEMARRGREEVERRHTWEALLPRLDDWLDQIKALPRRTRG